MFIGLLDKKQVDTLTRYGFERPEYKESRFSTLPNRAELALMLYKAHGDREKKDSMSKSD